MTFPPRCFVGFALIVLACGPVSAADEPPLVALRGRVVDAQTGEPVAKALVSLRGSKVEAVTDASGVDPRTGRVFLDSDTLFPLLPTAGVTVEF